MEAKDFKMDVVIPHLNNPGLRKSLETLRQRTPKENLGKVILIDCNPDGYQQVDDLVDIHIKMENQGFARNNNLGIRLSDAEFVGCMNDDVELIHPKWINGIVETFNRYSTALCVNPASPRNPRCSGCEPVDHPSFPHKDEWTEEEYDKLLTEVGKGYVIDGICMFFPIFRREMLEKLPGSIPGKCWLDEYFYPGGGEDYDMDRRAYLSGMRCLGSNLAYVYHYWYSTIKPGATEPGVKYDGGLFDRKWGIFDLEGKVIDKADIYGKTGNKNIPLNKIRG